jgi:hypothetical protein
MLEATTYDRRRFLGTTAMTLVAAPLGMRGVAHAQPRQTTPADVSTRTPHPGGHTQRIAQQTERVAG